MHTAPISFHDRIESGLHNEVMRGALGTATSRFAANRLAALATLPDADAVSYTHLTLPTSDLV